MCAKKFVIAWEEGSYLIVPNTSRYLSGGVEISQYILRKKLHRTEVERTCDDCRGVGAQRRRWWKSLGEGEVGGGRGVSVATWVKFYLDFQVFFVSRGEKGFLKGRGRRRTKKARRSYFVRSQDVDIEFGLGRERNPKNTGSRSQRPLRNFLWMARLGKAHPPHIH